MVTIRTRVVLAVFVLVSAGFYVSVDWVLDELRPHSLGIMEESMVDAATILAASAVPPGASSTLDLAPLRHAFDEARARRFQARIYSHLKNRMELRVTVVDLAGRVVFDSEDGAEEGKDHSRWNDVVRTLRGEYGARTSPLDATDPTGTAVLHVAAPVRAGGATAGVLTVAKSAESIGTLLRSAKRRVSSAGLGAAAAVLGLAFLLTTWITRPIERLRRHAQDVRDGRRVPLPDLGRSEIGALGDAFESMREALEGRQYVEEYVQTLTHEMKAPLSAIRGAAELLEDDLPADRRARFAGTIRHEAERLGALVDRLLRLASVERRRTLRDAEDLDAAVLLDEALAGTRDALESKRLTVERSMREGLRVRGERFLLVHALENLVRNAAEFAPPGSTLQVAAGAEGPVVEWSIEDSGPGIPEYALDKVFDRFYSLARPETGRKSTGLGLTITREVASLHGGTVALGNRPGGGARAVLRIPPHGGIEPT